MATSVPITSKTVVVNVNRNTINSNSLKAKAGQSSFEPPIRVSKGKSGKSEYGNEVAVLDEDGNEVARFIYDPASEVVSCGARLVLVAHHGARVVS